MALPDLYDLLIERARSPQPVRRVWLGLNWSMAQVESWGLCFSPTDPSRALEWPGTLAGRAAAELAPWILRSEAPEATVGACVINAVINRANNECLSRALPLTESAPPHLAVFAHFRPRLRGARVVVIGRYPGLESLWDPRDYVCLERRPAPGTLPESAAVRELARADWVFLTASSIANHTLPQLLRWLRPGATSVLLGPSLPWIADWADFGLHYVAGVAVRDAEELAAIVGEGGGTRIFQRACGYHLLALR
jgi:uncharacterized protein (DUF4213/DUF364 family)